jgi:hypothetical protein
MPDWREVEGRIVEGDRNKWDRKAPAAALRIAEGGVLELNRDGRSERLALSELATSQMCGRLGIPVPYYRRLPTELRATVANYDFGRLAESSYLLAARTNGFGRFCRQTTSPTITATSPKPSF